MSSYRNLFLTEVKAGKMAQCKFFSPSGLLLCLGLNLWKVFPVGFCRPCEKSNSNERLRARRDREREKKGDRIPQNEKGTGKRGAAGPKAASRCPETHLYVRLCDSV